MSRDTKRISGDTKLISRDTKRKERDTNRMGRDTKRDVNDTLGRGDLWGAQEEYQFMHRKRQKIIELKSLCIA